MKAVPYADDWAPMSVQACEVVAMGRIFRSHDPASYPMAFAALRIAAGLLIGAGCEVRYG